MAKKTKRSQPAQTEKVSKVEKFVTLGEKRTAKALKAVRQIGNLANRASYEYSPEQVARIHDALADAVKHSRARFEKGEKSEQAFKL